MHSLFVVAWYPTIEDMFLGKFVKEHANAVSKYCKVSLIYLRFNKTLKYPLINIRRDLHKEINEYIVDINFPLRKFGVFEYLVKHAYKKLFNEINSKAKVDIIHINVRSEVTKLFPEITNIPIVVTEHSTYYHTGVNQLDSKSKKQFIDAVNKWFNTSQIKCIMPVSREMGDVFVTIYDINKNKICVVPNVAGDEFYYQDKEQNDTQLKFLMVASWSNNKDPMLFFEALDKLDQVILSNISVRIIGEGIQYPQMIKYLKSSSKLKQSDIQFLGWQEKREIADEMRKADWLVHPTKSENLPTVIVESLSTGTPVLTNNVNGIPEMIDKSNGIMCEPGNVEEFSKAIISIYDKSFVVDNKSVSQKASEIYSASAIGKLIFEEYRKAL